MAISVKNHEDRIAVLEKKAIDSIYQEKVIFGTDGKLIGAGDTTITLTESWKNFNCLRIMTTNSSGTRNDATFRVSDLKLLNNVCTVDFDGGRTTVTFTSDTKATISNGSPNYLNAITGIKFSNVILYYVSNIIYIKFKLRLNSAIVILTHLRFKRRCKKVWLLV